MKKRGRLPNVSTFAFTATPKPKTMELFGIKRPDGKFEPFSLYTMRQAIEERFILDVLENYTTYKSYFNLLKKIQDDPRYDRARRRLPCSSPSWTSTSTPSTRRWRSWWSTSSGSRCPVSAARRRR